MGKFEPHNTVYKKKLTIKHLIIILIFISLVAVAYLCYVYQQNRKINSVIPHVSVGDEPMYLMSIYGSKDKPLKSPMAAYVNKQGNVYISNTNKHEIQVFKSNGQYLFSFGNYGDSRGSFSFPYGITENSIGNILVADTGNARIQEFTPEGKLVKLVKLPKDVDKLKKPGPLFYKNSKLYIGDLIRQEVIIFDEKNKTVQTLKNIQYPHGLSVDNDGNLYVADSGNYRIIIYNPSGKVKKIISSIDGNNPFSLLRGLAVDENGRLFVVDSISSVIWTYNQQGRLLFGLGSRGFGDGQFLYPTGIFADYHNKLYIADWANNRIQIWGYDVQK